MRDDCLTKQLTSLIEISHYLAISIKHQTANIIFYFVCKAALIVYRARDKYLLLFAKPIVVLTMAWSNMHNPSTLACLYKVSSHDSKRVVLTFKIWEKRGIG